MLRVGRVQWRLEKVSAAGGAFARALELLGPSDSTGAAEILLQWRTCTPPAWADKRMGLVYAEPALAMVDRLGDRHLEAQACSVLGNVKARANDLEGGREFARARTRTRTRRRRSSARRRGVCVPANLYAFLGQMDRSRELSVGCGVVAADAEPVPVAALLLVDCVHRCAVPAMGGDRAAVRGAGTVGGRALRSGAARHPARRMAGSSGTCRAASKTLLWHLGRYALSDSYRGGTETASGIDVNRGPVHSTS